MCCQLTSKFPMLVGQSYGVHIQILFLNFERDLVASMFLGGLRAPPSVFLIVSQKYMYDLILGLNKHF